MNWPIPPIILFFVSWLATGPVTLAGGPAGSAALSVPRGSPPSLDGNLSPDEWKDARRIEIPGGEILLQHAGGSLYLGLRTSARAVGSICVDQGDRIAVLHSSAALGTAVYERADARWRLTRPFVWRCRNQADTAERESFWRSEQWLASNALTGTPGEMEYRIAMPAGSLRLAVAFHRIPDRILLFWPAEVSDDSRSLDLIGGDAPGTLEFLPQEWITVTAAPDPAPSVATARGPYFGEPPPGDVPVLFAPGFLAPRFGFAARIAFSPDGRECLVTAADPKFSRPKIWVTELRGDTWTEPVVAPFTAGHFRSNEPFFSPDGNRLYFSSDPDGKSETNRRDIWMVERTPQGWGRLQRLPPPLNSDFTELFFSQAANGTIYFISNRPGGSGGFDLYRARPNPDRTLRVENLGAPLNSAANEWDPCVAPDGSFLIFASERPGGRGGSDLYVSFADGRGGWIAPVNLGGAFNSPGDEYAPSLSPDARYLFFTRYDGKRGQLYWVRTAAIGRFCPASSGQ